MIATELVQEGYALAEMSNSYGYFLISLAIIAVIANIAIGIFAIIYRTKKR